MKCTTCDNELTDGRCKFVNHANATIHDGGSQPGESQTRCTMQDEEDVEPTELEEAEEAAQDSYGELVDVLVENNLMSQDGVTFDHALTIGFTRELWGADCPDQFTQAAIIEKFFERLSLLSTTDALRIIAAYLKHADADNYVESLEEDAEEVGAK